MESDPTRMCALLVGLPDVTVVGVGDWPGWLRVVIVTELERPACCGRAAWRHGIREVVLVDLPVFGRPARLAWRKQRWRCGACRRSWTEQQPGIASSRCQLTTRAAKWATLQVGRHGRSVAEVATDLGCDWHTVMDAVVIYGTPLVDDPARFGAVSAVGLDETLFAREGRFRRQRWSTQIVDRAAGSSSTSWQAATQSSCAGPGGPWCRFGRGAGTNYFALKRSLVRVLAFGSRR